MSAPSCSPPSRTTAPPASCASLACRAALGPVQLDAALNRRILLENDVVFGTVNANERHYRAAVDALTSADLDWLYRVITRRVPLTKWADALDRQADDVKVVIDMAKGRAPDA